MLPVIAITAGSAIGGHQLTFVRLNHDYVRAVLQAGGMPVVLPSVADMPGEDYVSCVDGLLLSGGMDIDPAHYSQPNCGSMDIDPCRDALELALCRAMVAAGKPVLGICRGIQTLNVALGGTLWQDIKQDTGVQHSDDWTARHQVAIHPESFLYPMLGSEHQVNSTHHQAVRDVAPGLMAVAWCDGLVEAVQAADGRPVWGIQWHPERILDEDPAMAAIFSHFVQYADRSIRRKV